MVCASGQESILDRNAFGGHGSEIALPHVFVGRGPVGRHHIEHDCVRGDWACVDHDVAVAL